MSATLPIYQSDFGPVRRLVFQSDHFRVERFVYDSGVEALQIWNERGSIIALPYRGQQIWNAEFDGAQLCMESQFDEPTMSLAYLESYGAFFLHCGITAMGDPGPDDTHVLHGELPTAMFVNCSIQLSSDGRKLSLSGSYRHRVAFETDYKFETKYTLTDSSAMLLCEISVSNMRASPLELMYLGHINFRPIQQARHFTNQLSEMPISERYEKDALERLSALSFTFGATGKCLQLHPDGAGDYVWQNSDELPYAVRWICETDKERAMAIALPASCLTTGRASERRAGRIPSISGHETWRAEFGFGRLSSDEAQRVIRIDEITEVDLRSMNMFGVRP